MSSPSRAVLVAAFLLGSYLTLHAQVRQSTAPGSAGIWNDADEKSVARSIRATIGREPRREIVPRIYRVTALNKAALQAVLGQALPEQSGPIATTGTELSIPLPNGGYGRFLVQESPVMAPGLARRFSEIKTYVAQGMDDPTATARIDVTPRGFHAIILSGSGDIYIDPYSRETDTTYISYFKRDFVADKPFSCLSEQEAAEHKSLSRPTPYRPTGSKLRTYRLALACTGEYAVAVSGNPATLAGTLSAMVTSVNRCSAVYEREFAIRFQLIDNDDKLVYLNSATDPYTNANGSTMLGQNQTNIDAVIGAANYDFGHVFSTGGGGVANLGVICRSGSKARGVTGLTNPTGDPYDIDYVVHEMGHEFGANHPFNSSVSNCSGANRNANTAYEVGSGTTIMAYAGICGNTNLAPHSDDYFYTISYDEIDTYTSTGSGSGCPVSTTTGNTAPTVGALGTFTIPAQTPFALTASATDPDGDTLTYCWEEFDKGSAQGTANPVDTGNMPIFRSYPPTTNPTRVFPALTYILNNANLPPASNPDGYSTGEVLPITGRAMNFRVTVRDNRAGGGGSNYGSTTITSVAAAGPFAVTAPNTATTIAGGSMQTVTWNVASTNVAPISCANVKISLSTDGGRTFPFVLASSVPNAPGSASVSIPNVANVATTQGRIKVEAVGNIFFDISDANLAITSTNIAPSLGVTGSITVVRGMPTATVATVATASDADDNPVTVAVSDVPFGAHITPSINDGNISFSAIVDCPLVTTLTTRTYPITLTVTDSIGSTTSAIVNLIVAPNPSPTLGAYPDVSVARGGTITSTPAAQAADTNGNLLASPYSVLPATLPGGGSISVNQATGVVTATTTAGTTLGATSVRVTALDSCGAAVVKFFNLTVVTPTAPSFTNGPPPSPVVVGTPYNFSFSATGNPAPAFSLTSGTLPPGLSLSSNGVLSGTPTSAGTGSFPNITVTAGNGAAPNAQQTFSLAAITKVANYLAGFGLTGGTGALLFDYDGDNIVNLLEYALGLDPTIASENGLPVVMIKNYSGTNYLSMTFNRSSVATDLTYTVQASTDLISWSDLGSSTGGGVTSGVGFIGETGSAPTFHVEVRDTVPLDSANGQKRFMRLKATTP